MLIKTMMTPHWIHIPTPGDHYSPSTGSAVMTVIYEINRCQHADGGRCSVVISEGTYTDYYNVGQPMLVPASAPPSTALKLFDVASARLGLPRFFSARPYRPSVRAIEPAFEGCVFVHNGPQALPLLRKRAPRCKLYLYAHNDLLRTYSRREAERLLSHADGVICVSDYIRRVTADKAPAAADKLHVVLNGVNPEVFKPAAAGPNNPEPVILFVGRMVPEKGAHVLIQAAKRLAEQGVVFKLQLVGSQGFTGKTPLSNYERSVREQASALGDRVAFTPFVPREQVVGLYHGADVFCVPSVWEEPLGLIVGEGMASGLPVVASMRGGIPEVGGDCVRYFDPTQPDKLAAELKPYLVDAELRQRDGRACLNRAQSLNWSAMYRALCEAVACAE